MLTIEVKVFMFTSFRNFVTLDCTYKSVGCNVAFSVYENVLKVFRIKVMPRIGNILIESINCQPMHSASYFSSLKTYTTVPMYRYVYSLHKPENKHGHRGNGT
jgi:hypothetical protein